MQIIRKIFLTQQDFLLFTNNEKYKTIDFAAIPEDLDEIKFVIQAD